MTAIRDDLGVFLLDELKTRDIGTLTALKLAITGQIQEERANSTVLMWPEARKPFGEEMRAVLEAEWESMTQLEIDVSDMRVAGTAIYAPGF